MEPSASRRAFEAAENGRLREQNRLIRPYRWRDRRRGLRVPPADGHVQRPAAKVCGTATDGTN